MFLVFSQPLDSCIFSFKFIIVLWKVFSNSRSCLDDTNLGSLFYFLKNIYDLLTLFRVTRIFLATTAHCHDRAAIKIHITHFTRIFNDHLIL